MDELAEKIFNAVLSFTEDVDSGKLSMTEAKDYAIGYISTEISEVVEQRQEASPLDAIVSLSVFALRKYRLGIIN